MSRIDLDEDRSSSSWGTPELRFTSSTPGTMALYVGANGQGGCYRYKVEVTPPARSTAPASAPQAAANVANASKSAVPMAIVGQASSAKHCAAGNYVSNVHEIGRVEQGNVITITFQSDFDPVAGVTLINLGTQRGTYLVDDDTGGNLDPRLSFTASHASTIALYVAGFGGDAGCYSCKVEIR